MVEKKPTAGIILAAGMSKRFFPESAFSRVTDLLNILKSVNQQWNKRKARLYSIKDKQQIAWTTQLDEITTKRNSIMKDYLHSLRKKDFQTQYYAYVSYK